MIKIGSTVVKLRRKMSLFIRLDDKNERHYARNGEPYVFSPSEAQKKNVDIYLVLTMRKKKHTMRQKSRTIIHGEIF